MKSGNGQDLERKPDPREVYKALDFLLKAWVAIERAVSRFYGLSSLSKQYLVFKSHCNFVCLFAFERG